MICGSKTFATHRSRQTRHGLHCLRESRNVSSGRTKFWILVQLWFWKRGLTASSSEYGITLLVVDRFSIEWWSPTLRRIYIHIMYHIKWEFTIKTEYLYKTALGAVSKVHKRRSDDRTDGRPDCGNHLCRTEHFCTLINNHVLTAFWRCFNCVLAMVG